MKKKSGYPKITKMKDGSIKITNFVRGTKIRLEVKASFDDWTRLHALYIQQTPPSHRIAMFTNDPFVVSFLRNIPHKDERRYYLENLKWQSWLFYSYFKRLFSMQRKEWPYYFKALLDDHDFKEDFKIYYKKKNGKYDPGFFALYFIKAFYDEGIKKYNLSIIDTTTQNNFYITYVVDGKKLFNDGMMFPDGEIFDIFFPFAARDARIKLNYELENEFIEDIQSFYSSQKDKK